jgi:hypothetical protein
MISLNIFNPNIDYITGIISELMYMINWRNNTCVFWTNAWIFFNPEICILPRLKKKSKETLTRCIKTRRAYYCFLWSTNSTSNIFLDSLYIGLIDIVIDSPYIGLIDVVKEALICLQTVHWHNLTDILCWRGNQQTIQIQVYFMHVMSNRIKVFP